MDRRLYEHGIGHSKFTSNGVPWLLVYKEHYQTLPEAKKQEAYIKRVKKRKYIELPINRGMLIQSIKVLFRNALLFLTPAYSLFHSVYNYQ